MSPRTLASALVSPALVAACVDGNRIEALEPVPSSAVVERVAEGVLSAVPVPHHRYVLADADGLWLTSPRGELVELDASGAPVQAAVRTGGGAVLVATADDLFVHDGWAGPSTLREAVSLPLTGLTADGDDLWVGTPDGLLLWRGGWLHDVRVGRKPLTGPFAVADGRAWVATRDGVAVLEEAREGFLVVDSRRDTPADALAVDGDGAAWIVTDGALVRHDGAFTEITTPTPALGVLASPSAPGAWVFTEGATLFVDADGALAFDDLPPADTRHVDEAGRLVLVDGAGAAWLASPRPGGVFVGVEQGGTVEGTVEVRIRPSPADLVASVEARLDGEPVDVLEDPWRVLLDAGPLSGGAHTLTARVSWDDGPTADVRPVTFSVDRGTVVTWDDHVRPLHERSCAVCHEGETETVLDGREAWQARVDDILEEVTAGRMPLAGTRLTDAEIARIRAWKDGGFP